ncbi:MAG: hypothetical protein ACREEM_01130 [Blastocatellia bacterium]
MNLRRKIELDRAAIQRFRSREKEPLTIPNSILEETRLNDHDRSDFGLQPGPRRTAVKVAEPGPPETQYTDAQGYVLSWGHILERRVNPFVIRDFCLTHLLTHYHRRGLRLRDLQRIVFAGIEAEVDCASREPVMAVGLIGGWALYPGAAVGAITEVVHFASEEKAREWTAETLIENVLPKAIARAREFADRYGH